MCRPAQSGERLRPLCVAQHPPIPMNGPIGACGGVLHGRRRLPAPRSQAHAHRASPLQTGQVLELALGTTPQGYTLDNRNSDAPSTLPCPRFHIDRESKGGHIHRDEHTHNFFFFFLHPVSVPHRTWLVGETRVIIPVLLTRDDMMQTQSRNLQPRLGACDPTSRRLDRAFARRVLGRMTDFYSHVAAPTQPNGSPREAYQHDTCQHFPSSSRASTAHSHFDLVSHTAALQMCSRTYDFIVARPYFSLALCRYKGGGAIGKKTV